MWKLLLVLTFKTVISDEIFTNTFSVTDQCIGLCKDSQLPSLDLVNAAKLNENYEQIVCQRGCRFFNIIHFKDELNINTTRKECHLSCNESYIIPKENEICLQGCNLMAKKRHGEMSTFIVLTEEEEDSNNIVLAEPDLEILESDILSDPSIKSQLEIGFNIDYKIPETHIRTMPIEFKDDAVLVKSDYSGDWLDCASRNSGIPRWILLTAFLSAVLVALWLSFSTEKKNNEEIVEVDVSDEKLIIEHEEKDPALLERSQEIGFSTPPAYSVESEKV